MNKFAWTLNENGWSIQKQAQAPTAEQVKEVARKATEKTEQDASKAMQAITGKPMASTPQGQQQQMANIGQDAAVNMANKAGLKGSNAKEMIGNAVAKSGLGAVMGALSPGREQAIGQLSDPSWRQSTLANLQAKLDKRMGNPKADQEVISILKSNIELISAIDSGKMTPEQAYAQAEQMESARISKVK